MYVGFRHGEETSPITLRHFAPQYLVAVVARTQLLARDMIRRFSFVCFLVCGSVTSLSLLRRRQKTASTVFLGASRRNVLLIGGGLLSSNSLLSPVNAVDTGLIADVPMIRLKLPQEGFGREYVVIQLMIQKQGPYDFMVDSGLSTEMITPHLQQELHLESAVSGFQGIVAGGNTASTKTTQLDGASLCCGQFANGQKLFPLSQLTAIITDFPQEHIDPSRNVEGMLGMELLSQFDVDFDFPNNRLRLYKPGTAATKDPSLIPIPAVVINETGLIGIRLHAPKATNPVLAFLDCGASFSVVNWSAARLLGLPSKEDSIYRRGPAISAIGVDGRAIQMPVVSAELNFAGDIIRENGKPVGFQSPPPDFKNWQTKVAVGDLGVFPSLLGDGERAYLGPAALIGLDILSQRRLILGSGPPGTRQRKVWIGK